MPVKKQITQTYERYKAGGTPGKSIDRLKSNIRRNQTGQIKTLKQSWVNMKKVPVEVQIRSSSRI